MSSTPTPPTAKPSASERKALALQRIEASRTQLILRIYPEPANHSRTSAQPTAPPPVWDGMAGLMARAERNGLFKAAWRTARALGRRWWTRQPWHASVDLVASTLAHEAKPIMNRHPLATLAVGGAAGAALAVALPWATRSLKAQAAPWRHNLGGMIWHQLGQAPVQLALTGALTAWIAEVSQRAASDPTPPAAPPSAGSPTAAASAPPR